MLHKLVIKAKVTIHIYENTYFPKSFGKFSSKLCNFTTSIAVYYSKLSKHNQEPFITVLSKNTVFCEDYV